jgi:hypothetical protein
MIRVTKSEERERTIVTIDGQLSGDYIEIVEVCCLQAESEGKPIDVFLNDVSTIDESGRTLLTRLAAKGIRLVATGMYTSYVVRDLVAAIGRSRRSAGHNPYDEFRHSSALLDRFDTLRHFSTGARSQFSHQW